MNETIGVRGGANDRRRTIKISRKQKLKLQKIHEENETKKLEKEVKKKQVFVLIRTIPIALTGGAIQFIKDGKRKEDSIKEVPIEETPIVKEEDKEIVHLPDGQEIIVTVNLPMFKNNKVLNTQESTVLMKPKDIVNTQEPTITMEQKEIIMPQVVIPSSTIVEEELSEKSRNTFSKLKNHKIIDEYEKELKDIRYDLRKVVFDYEVLEPEEEKITFMKEAEYLLDRLSEVIQKLEVLKQRIQVDNINQYDHNYLYFLIEDYLKEFRDKRIVQEMKDSPLYILIAEKIEEIDKKKDSFQEKLEEKKEKYQEREENFDKLKEKYYDLSRMNKELLELQYEQDKILKDLRKKIDEAMTVKERVEVKAEAMNKHAKRMFTLLGLSMFLRGGRSAKSMAAITASYIYFAKQVAHPKMITKKYRVIEVKDYREDIYDSMSELEKASYLLRKTDRMLDSVILEIREEFKDYIGVLPECDQLLSNLEKIKSNLHEKEYEMEKLQKEQVELLEKNEAKILSRGEYPM